MDFIFISMPYGKFDSRWFSNVPNINLGILDAFLSQHGKQVKTFHWHLAFVPFLRELGAEIRENFVKLAQQFGVEYLGLDYVFASLLFEDRYQRSRPRFQERLKFIGLTLEDFEALRGVAKAFVDSTFSELCEYLEGTRLVGFSCSHYQLSGSLLMCSKIKEAYPRVQSVVGGKDCAGAFAEELLSNMDIVDFVGTGECEVTVADLLEHLNDRKKPLHNLVFRDAKGKAKKSESKPNLSINSLPFPKYGFTDFPIEPGDVILPIELGRGCPWGKCTFCPDESYHVRCQSKSATKIKAEMAYYQETADDLKNFIILDSDALKDRKLVLELSEYLKGKNLLFHFAEFRAERMDRKVLESLLSFGHWASHFQVGIETFSDRVLRLMKKGVTLLKNVEVLKMVAELGVPLQFNLFTCYPNMTTEDLMENLRVMDRIAHLLVYENIQIYPGEFYLPTDCPVFLDIGQYRLQRSGESVFSDIFLDFPMPSYSNYPYPYQFDNDEEQFNIAARIREKVEDIKGRSPSENFMHYLRTSQGLEITLSQNGARTKHTLSSDEAEIYLSAIEKSQRISNMSKRLGISSAKIRSILDDFDQKGLIIYSSDRKSFLSLATRYTKGSIK
jgi:radical SAM superfamily enzyme YgiQ (UPF0313 family)